MVSTVENPAHVGTAFDMEKACWKYAFGNEHMQRLFYSMTDMKIRGDRDFYVDHSVGNLVYDGCLDVLKHGAPGILVEGCFDLDKERTGNIFGIVRDLHEKFRYAGYKPLNGVIVNR